MSEQIKRSVVTTLVEGHPLSLDNCDREAIHIPGYIQPHGVLLAIRPSDLTIVQVSRNVSQWLGQSTGEWLGRRLAEVVGAAEADGVARAIATRRLTDNPTYVFTTTGASAMGPLDATAHVRNGTLILELERSGRTTTSSVDYHALVRATVARLQTATGLHNFCAMLCAEIRELTGVDRVMVYRFLEDASGQVFAEDARDGVGSWLGLHYPEVDIPRPAREMFEKIWIRPLPDVRAEQVPLVPELHPDTGTPLDMTYCMLRGASVMYTEYLENMGVTMSLTMALVREGRLWGLIACHHYTGPRHLDYGTRGACELLAQVASLQLSAAEQREDSAYRARLRANYDTMVVKLAAAEHLELRALVDGRPGLLEYLDCGGAAVSHNGEWWTKGNAPTRVQLNDLLGWLREQALDVSNPDSIVQTDRLSLVRPDFEDMKAAASGVLALPISRSGRDWVIWFRPERIKTVTWAGNPHEKPVKYGSSGVRLHPRTSFELWKESVAGQAIPWKTVEIEAARQLRLAILELAAARADRLAKLNHELELSNAELDSFAYVASHDLKEPLRGIYQYAQWLEERCGERLAPDEQQRLVSLKRLTQRMDGLIESLLHFSRVGRLDLELEPADLGEVLEEAIDMLRLSRPDAGIELRLAPLPTVPCDRIRIREVFCNLLTNAAKYNDKAEKWIEVGQVASAAQGDGNRTAETVIYVRDNGIGIKPRYYEQIFKIFKRLHARDAFGGGSGSGLTIARKIVDRHGGRIWLESEPGVGTTFYFTLKTA